MYESARKSGIYRSYYRNGLLKVEGNFARNKENGEWRYYNEQSELVKVVTYEYGTLVVEEKVR